MRRPFKLPEWMKYVALAMAALYAVIYFYGGPVYASCSCNAAGRKTLPYYFIGIGVLLPYLPLYYWRKRDDRQNAGPAPPAVGAPASRPGGQPVSAAPSTRDRSRREEPAAASSGSCSPPRAGRSPTRRSTA